MLKNINNSRFGQIWFRIFVYVTFNCLIRVLICTDQNLKNMAKIIKKGQKYLLHWKKNRVTAKRELSDIKNLHQLNGRYYTVVKPKMSGSFTIVDVQYKNDSFPVNANNLIEI